MSRLRLLVAPVVCLLAVGLLYGGGTDLVTAHGSVDKVEKDSLTLRPRNADGTFAKSLTLKLTGTSKVTVVTQEKRGGKLVPVQREIDAKDLEKGQHVAVIYNAEKDGGVVLSAIAQPKKK